MNGLNLLPSFSLVATFCSSTLEESSEGAKTLHGIARCKPLQSVLLKLQYRDRAGNMLRLCDVNPHEEKLCADILLQIEIRKQELSIHVQNRIGSNAASRARANEHPLRNTLGPCDISSGCDI